MKLCPQCEFIYEDDQSLCDMDGRDLIYDPGPFAEETILSPSAKFHEANATPVSPTAAPQASPLPGRQSRISAVAALAAIILAALLFVVYYARTHQLRSANTNQAANQASTQSSNQSTQLESVVPQPAPVVSTPPDIPSSPAGSAAGSLAESTSSPRPISPEESFRGGRVAVSARGLVAENRAPAIVWLTNGSSIKVDEAWQRKEGVWYRQAGVVTFLKRSQVRSIQRPAPANARVKSTVPNTAAKQRKPQNTNGQNQVRITRVEVASTKKESKVSSFLKKTGRMLKKPFQL